MRRFFITSGISTLFMTAKFSFLIFLLLSQLSLAEGNPFAFADSTSGRTLVPIGGNTFLTSTGNTDQVTSAGIKEWTSPQSLLTTYVHLASPQKALLQLEIAEQSHGSEIEVSVGSYVRRMVIPKGVRLLKVGEVPLRTGYNRITFKGIHRIHGNYADLKAISLDTEGQGLNASFVEDNIDNRFYWGRRGPSVHLSYLVPDESEDRKRVV